MKIALGGIMTKQETPLEAYNELIDLLLFFVESFGIRNPEKQREIDQRIQLVREALERKGNENMKKNYFYKAKIKSTQGLEDHDFIQDSLVQELSTGEVGERDVNYKIEKTKIIPCVNDFITSGLMKINNIIIEDYHKQDCCEHVYADFSALEDTTFFDELKGKNLTAKEVANNIELVEGNGFRIFGYFVPCYNVQDGYYSSNLTLIITEEHRKNKIEINLTNCTSWRSR